VRSELRAGSPDPYPAFAGHSSCKPLILRVRVLDGTPYFTETSTEPYVLGSCHASEIRLPYLRHHRWPTRRDYRRSDSSGTAASITRAHGGESLSECAA
jgi:hypothetical protein